MGSHTQGGTTRNADQAHLCILLTVARISGRNSPVLKWTTWPVRTYRRLRSKSLRVHQGPRRRNWRKVCRRHGHVSRGNLSGPLNARAGSSVSTILFTNVMMAELLLTRQDGLYFKVIENARDSKLVVLDELHTYRGRQGANVAILVRRLRDELIADAVDRGLFVYGS